MRPRLDTAGADTERVLAFNLMRTADGERLPTLDDLAALEDAITATNAALVIVDPLMAYLPPGANAHRDQDIRRVLSPLGKLAERTRAAIAIVRHVNKAVGMSALHRGGGSIGIIGAARAGLLVAPDPAAPEGKRRILAVTKSNLAPPAASLAYHMETAANGAARIVWDGPVAVTAAQLVAPPSDTEERGAVEEAQDFIRGLLADGPVPVAIATQAVDAAGISRATRRRAFQAIGCSAYRDKETNEYHWRLPAPEAA